jgi:hypothetical protein
MVSKRMDFARVEPEAGQFVLGAAVRVRRVEAVAAGSSISVPDDGGVEPVAHVFEVALERGARDFQRLLQLGEGHQPPVVNHLVDLVETLSAVHGGSRK